MISKGSTNGSSGTLREPLKWGAIEVCSSALYITLCVIMILVVALGVLELIGFGSLTQWHAAQIEVAGT